MSVTVPVLLLNASYEPISVCTAKRAIKMWSKGIVRIEETYDRTCYRSMRLPSVVRLSHYRRIPLKGHAVSRRNILLRDRNTCQYCGCELSAARLTLDHVKPRSRGGLSIWENLVACCFPCNNRKADKTPEEAGMKLLVSPKAMTLHTHRSLMRAMGEQMDSWRKYLYF